MVKTSIIYENHKYDNEYVSRVINKFITYFVNNDISVDYSIAIAMERTPAMLLAIRAAHLYGIPFMPIDMSLPTARINYMIQKLNPQIVICDRTSNSVLYRGIKNKILYDDIMDIPIIDSEVDYASIKKSSIAYILFTSGTTGVPKGVEITRLGLNNVFKSLSKNIDMSSVNTIACFTTQGFDIFFVESLFAFEYNKDIVLATEKERKNPLKMARLIIKHNVDLVQFTPSGLNMFINTTLSQTALSQIKVFLIGGEVFPNRLLNYLKKNTVAKIYNLYGPTETTIWSAIADLTECEKVIIGKPICNTEFLMIDNNNNITNNIGELCISGFGLAKGYLNDNELTKQKFIYLNGIRAYKTGDLVQVDLNGNYEYLGRIDNQIKYNGHRVEVEEIEANIEQTIGVSCLVKLEDGNLCAYYVCEKDLLIEQLIEILCNKLPKYMIPTKWYRICAFDYTSNGKLNRNYNYKDNLYQNIDDIEETKFNEQYLDFCKTICTVLDLNFNEILFYNNLALERLGINSINFIKLVVALEQKYKMNFDEDMLIYTEYKNINELYDYINNCLTLQ